VTNGRGGELPEFAASVHARPGIATQIRLSDYGSSLALLVISERRLIDPAQDLAILQDRRDVNLPARYTQAISQTSTTLKLNVAAR
jgi:hypothetical protein